MSAISAKTAENPFGVFWDIENCAVPRNKSASELVKKIRNYIIRPYNYREYEFFCSCDTSQLHPIVCEELNVAGVTVAHVPATSKNASDEKIKEQMAKFVDTHRARCTLMLISGDVNFVPAIRGFRDRIGARIIIMYTASASRELISCADAGSFNFTEFSCDIPERKLKPVDNGRPAALNRNNPPETTQYVLKVTNLPQNLSVSVVRAKLNLLTQNCGGKLLYSDTKSATIRFSSQRDMERSKSRLDGYEMDGVRIAAEIATARVKPQPQAPVQVFATVPSVQGAAAPKPFDKLHSLVVTGIPLDYSKEELKQFLTEKSSFLGTVVSIANGRAVLAFGTDARSTQMMNKLVGCHLLNGNIIVINPPLQESAEPSGAQRLSRASSTQSLAGPGQSGTPKQLAILTASGIPGKMAQEDVKDLLSKRLKDCKPKVMEVSNGTAKLTFNNFKIAKAAQTRLNGFQIAPGHTVKVNFSTRSASSCDQNRVPLKSKTVQVANQSTRYLCVEGLPEKSVAAETEVGQIAAQFSGKILGLSRRHRTAWLEFRKAEDASKALVELNGRYLMSGCIITAGFTTAIPKEVRNAKESETPSQSAKSTTSGVSRPLQTIVGGATGITYTNGPTIGGNLSSPFAVPHQLQPKTAVPLASSASRFNGPSVSPFSAQDAVAAGKKEAYLIIHGLPGKIPADYLCSELSVVLNNCDCDVVGVFNGTAYVKFESREVAEKILRDTFQSKTVILLGKAISAQLSTKAPKLQTLIPSDS